LTADSTHDLKAY